MFPNYHSRSFPGAANPPPPKNKKNDISRYWILFPFFRNLLVAAKLCRIRPLRQEYRNGDVTSQTKTYSEWHFSTATSEPGILGFEIETTENLGKAGHPTFNHGRGFFAVPLCILFDGNPPPKKKFTSEDVLWTTLVFKAFCNAVRGLKASALSLLV